MLTLAVGLAHPVLLSFQYPIHAYAKSSNSHRPLHLWLTRVSITDYDPYPSNSSTCLKRPRETTSRSPSSILSVPLWKRNRLVLESILSPISQNTQFRNQRTRYICFPSSNSLTKRASFRLLKYLSIVSLLNRSTCQPR